MKPFAALGIAIAIATSAGLASAQTNQAPLSRAEVKAETRALEMAHKLTPAGQGIDPYRAPSAGSTTTRAERKAQTVSARKAGDLEPAGDASELKADRLAMSAKPVTTSAERKAETRAAEKAGLLTPAGQGPDAPKH